MKKKLRESVVDDAEAIEIFFKAGQRNPKIIFLITPAQGTCID